MTPLRTVTGAEAIGLRDQLVETYAAVFCAPPWNESAERATRFGDLLVGWAGQPGFVAVLVGNGGTVTGFALGLDTPTPFPADRAYGSVRNILGPAVEPFAGWLEVAELAVRPDARRAGLGRRLLATLTGDRPSWLLTVTDVEETLAFYDAAGWLRQGSGYGITVYTNRPPPTPTRRD
ncbi:GNAT family N-acetyltransferase [Plantactinospora sp. S1510]|uniref:GNAT family N-acetyltransferase n=1 Tax=Plantactinospora alkalitolerans TaxID=2789879 RepID=A0ABS0GWG7_9ACTN|nr:GNAT family N-acetyltransferase [Plantactinospora alkalitolerans]MBF9130549.1 GNAT family N-acetyltransferase [Plantactinospora alkalitolerans]